MKVKTDTDLQVFQRMTRFFVRLSSPASLHNLSQERTCLERKRHRDGEVMASASAGQVGGDVPFRSQPASSCNPKPKCCRFPSRSQTFSHRTSFFSRPRITQQRNDSSLSFASLDAFTAIPEGFELDSHTYFRGNVNLQQREGSGFDLSSPPCHWDRSHRVDGSVIQKAIDDSSCDTSLRLEILLTDQMMESATCARRSRSWSSSVSSRCSFVKDVSFNRLALQDNWDLR